MSNIDWQDKSDYWMKRSAMRLRRYYEVAAALGFSMSEPGMLNVSHDTILARARACKAAYDQVKEGRV